MNKSEVPSDVIEEIKSILDDIRHGRDYHQDTKASCLPAAEAGNIHETGPNRLNTDNRPPVGTAAPLNDVIELAAPNETADNRDIQIRRASSTDFPSPLDAKVLNTEAPASFSMESLPPPQVEQEKIRKIQGEETVGTNSKKCNTRTYRTSHQSAQTPHENVKEARHQIRGQVLRDHLEPACLVGVPPNLVSNSIECRECSAAFKNSTSLQSHITRVHSAKNAQSTRGFHRCPECQDVLVNKQNLDRHIVGHQTGTHKCDVCAVRYSSKRALTTHKLKRHDKTETTETTENDPSNIHVTDQSSPGPSRHPNTLGVAKRITKPHKAKQLEFSFSCPFCKKKDKWKANLQRHIDLVHKKKRTFSCPQCSMRFGTSQGLLSHQINHHRQ